MKKIALFTALAGAVAAGSLAPSVAVAANAKSPYKHVNHANDKGNPTGDADTAKLNQQQLDKIKSGG